MQNHLQAWIRLNIVEGIGIARKLELLRLSTEPEKLFLLDRNELGRLGLKPDQAEMFLSNDKMQESEMLLEHAVKKGIRIVPIDDEEYPEFLRYIHDPPLVLYVKGIIPMGLCMAVVGSRKASGYGTETAFKLSSDLAREGIIVVSGMARGIDTAAHTGALHAEGKTIAVLGCGPDKAYPPENRGLMERIANSGAVISEYPPGVGPQSYHFPVRNRLISGICIGVLVVEASFKSGSLITVQAALDQGRDVFAVPGNINHYNSMGTNKLIREGAKLVLSCEDILEEIPWRIDTVKMSGKSMKSDDISFEENKVLHLLRNEDMYDDQISEKSALPVNVLLTILLQLELKGMIRKDLTGRYAIVPQ